MAVRPPTTLPGRSSTDDLFGLFEHEVASEKASSLGRAGRRVESALAALRAHGEGEDARKRLLCEAADAVYAYFIQRELCGLRRHQDVIREYAIPREVLVRLGAR